ncbi:MAG: acylphosphatase [Euryarchaeota archaeon]|nr:acylphosphatase [Euryarchaeota archaeon]MCG2736760.1 acylphosphatase [Candidatus Methanoperedenaceae archaeon]
MQKCYNIMITGRVQDIGFRSLIEDIARLYDVRGFSFNDTDGSVKMVCCGDNGTITDFLDEIRAKGTQKGTVIEDIASEEIPFHIYLPQRFLRLYTDELADIGRKLDKGNEHLQQILIHTSELPGIKDGIDNLNSKFDSFIIEQREHNMRMDEHNQWMKGHLVKMDEQNQWMKEHNQRLEQILLKLAEK